MKNPAVDVEKPGPGRRENPLTEEHYKQIIEGTRDEPFRDLLTVAWECGPRAQELFRMRVRHIELDQARIMFPRDEAKGKKRPRYVYLTEKALEIVGTVRLKREELNGPCPDGRLIQPFGLREKINR